MPSLVAVELSDALRGGSVLGKRQRHTLALWDGVKLVVPRGVARAVAGHYVQVAYSEDPTDPGLYKHKAFNARAHAALGLDAFENVSVGGRAEPPSARVLQQHLLEEESDDFLELYQSAFIFLSNGVGLRVVDRQPHVVLDGAAPSSLRTLTVYRTVHEGWVPHRFLVQPAESHWTASPKTLWDVAQRLVPCERAYFERDVRATSTPSGVPGVRAYRLACAKPLRQNAPRRPSLRA